MILGLLNFGVLYGVMWLFERKRHADGDFNLVRAAAIPAFALAVATVLSLFLRLGIAGSIGALVIFVGATVWVLLTELKLPPKRAVAYSATVLVIDIGLLGFLAAGRYSV